MSGEVGQKKKQVLGMQMMQDTQNYSPAAIEGIHWFTELDVDTQNSIWVWLFFFSWWELCGDQFFPAEL